MAAWFKFIPLAAFLAACALKKTLRLAKNNEVKLELVDLALKLMRDTPNT